MKAAACGSGRRVRHRVDCRRLGFFARWQRVRRRCARRSQAVDVGINGAEIRLAHRAHVEPRHRGPRLHGGDVLDPAVRRQLLDQEPQVGGVGRAPGSGPADMAAGEALRDWDFAGVLVPALGMAVVATADRYGLSPMATWDGPCTAGCSEPAAPRSTTIATMPTARFISDLSCGGGKSVAMPHHSRARAASETFVPRDDLW